eukprot:CAMPEP_0170542482 /NCGR_PEP_ID=MMETSP0211-20121228/1889_1 /TAXON_ID=311385 /ORGANISM="Pseudokeronopsis sp., Strain OXSARD2" /LENGTH=46 /DNA_ID= /DNA_START= /DNA_END= /DNA_ORIENTATION=
MKESDPLQDEVYLILGKQGNSSKNQIEEVQQKLVEELVFKGLEPQE